MYAKSKISKNLSKFLSFLYTLIILSLLLTGCLKEREPTAPNPIERPQLVNQFDPSDGQLKVKQNKSIKIFFTEMMDVNSLQGRFTLKNYAGDEIEGRYSAEGIAAILTPVQSLEKNSIYKFHLKGRIRDIYGNSIFYNGKPVLDDTTLILSGWFYTEGGYSEGGYNPIYAADKSKIFVIDSLNTLVTEIESSDLMTGYAISEDGLYFIISLANSNRVDLINLQSYQVETSINVAQSPRSIKVKGNYAYIICDAGKSIEKININSKTLESTFILDFFPGEIELSSNGDRIYTLDQAKKDLVIIDASSGAVINRIAAAVTSYANGKLKIDDEGRLFICDTRGNKLNILKEENSISAAYEFTDAGPISICYDDNFLYAISGSSLYRLNKQTFSTDSSQIMSFSTPVRSLTMLPSKDILYVMTNLDLIIVDLKTFTSIAEIRLASTTLQEVINSPVKF